MQKSVIFVKKNLKINMSKIKNLEIVAIIMENIEILCIAYVNQNIVYLKKIPVAIHNGSKYYYHFIVKELVKEFKKHLLVQEKILKNT